MSVKGRKVSGRGETVAANYAFGPLEDDVMIKHRLPAPQQQEVNRHWRNFQRNSPPSSSKLRRTKITMVSVRNCLKPSYRSFLLLRFLVLKSKAVISANIREKDNFNELKDEINGQILQAQADIKELKKQLEESKIERKHKEEREAIRKLIAMQPLRSEIGCRCSFFFPPGRFGVLVRDLSAQRWCISSAIFAFCQTRLFNCADGLRNEFADMHRWTSHF